MSIDLTLLLRTTCELETYIVAVERIQEYAEAPREVRDRRVCDAGMIKTHYFIFMYMFYKVAMFK